MSLYEASISPSELLHCLGNVRHKSKKIVTGRLTES